MIFIQFPMQDILFSHSIQNTSLCILYTCAVGSHTILMLMSAALKELLPLPSVSSRGTVSFAALNISITHLGLHSLTEISDGDVVIRNNPKLCYTSGQQWRTLFKSDKQRSKVEGNANSTVCSKSVLQILFMKLATEITRQLISANSMVAQHDKKLVATFLSPQFKICLGYYRAPEKRTFLCDFSQSCTTTRVTPCAQRRGAGARGPRCASAACISYVGGAVWPPVTFCTGRWQVSTTKVILSDLDFYKNQLLYHHKKRIHLAGIVCGRCTWLHFHFNPVHYDSSFPSKMR